MSTEFEFDTPEDYGGDGQFLSQPGIYHCLVNEVAVGTGPKGNAIDGFCATLEVLDGTVRADTGCTEVGKKINLTYFNPKITEKDGGKFTRKKQAKFLIAANVLNPAEKGKKVKIDLNSAKDHQLVVRLEIDEYNSGDGKTYLQVAGAGLDVWHVDDPHAKACPKHDKALALIPADLRRKPEFFELIYEKKPVAAAAGSGKSSPQPTAASSGGHSRVNIDDL